MLSLASLLCDKNDKICLDEIFRLGPIEGLNLSMSGWTSELECVLCVGSRTKSFESPSTTTYLFTVERLISAPYNRDKSFIVPL